MSNKALTPIDNFKQQIASAQVQSNLREFMPNEKAMKKFTAVTIRAVQENPALLDADRKSLFLACQRAAQDGLMPDGREAALVPYGKEIQYQPMIQGIRKKLAQAGFDIRADIVYERDEFSFESGDNPQIIHRPNVFGDRGKIIGAYAIATDLNTGEKWRETMSIEELERVRNAARSKNSPAWTTWKTEMYRKTVAKRLRKYLPISDDSLLDLIDRDNDQFEMDQKRQPSDVAQAVQAHARGQAEPEPIEGELLEPEEKPKTKPKKKAQPKKQRTNDEIQEAVDDDNHVMSGEPPEFPGEDEDEEEPGSLGF